MDATTNKCSVVFSNSQPARPLKYILHEIAAQVELLCCHFADKRQQAAMCERFL